MVRARGASGEHEVSRRVKSELLVQIDRLNNSTNNTAGKPVTVLTATNFPWALDEALRRRLEKRIYIPLPDFKSRKELIKINLKSIMLAPGLDIDQVARRTEGYSGDDLTNICRDASLNGMRRKIAGKNPDEIKNISEAEILEIPVMMDDFLEAIDKIQPTVSAGDVERHEKWFSEFLENQFKPQSGADSYNCNPNVYNNEMNPFFEKAYKPLEITVDSMNVIFFIKKGNLMFHSIISDRRSLMLLLEAMDIQYSFREQNQAAAIFSKRRS
ncbi:katanin p60 ATPase-containing subunit A1-like [Nicotiana tomentosiformis]|uniref:katanin p60 ATPase-containing subunit A1-like n=1 Tax=Nicotiana tomentosiformis TaxID=4098 RepID=UPI00388C6120